MIRILISLLGATLAAAGELAANLRNGEGSVVAALVAGFSRSNLYAAANQGQVKQLALPFYARLMAEGCATGLPWTVQAEDDTDFAAVNAGQLKRVFAFELDADRNGVPDWWERENEGSGLEMTPGADADGDGAATEEERSRRTDPLDLDTDADGVDDLRDARPISASDSDGDGLPDDWERAWFGSLARSGSDDPDGDGRSDEQEFRELTDPTRADHEDGANGARLNVFRPRK